MKTKKMRKRLLAMLMALILTLSVATPGVAEHESENINDEPGHSMNHEASPEVEQEIALRNLVTIPDAYFVAALQNHLPPLPDNLFSGGQLDAGIAANVSMLDLSDRNISDLSGIEHFTALTQLAVNNNNLTTLDVSNNTVLWWLDVRGNLLPSEGSVTGREATQLSLFQFVPQRTGVTFEFDEESVRLDDLEYLEINVPNPMSFLLEGVFAFDENNEPLAIEVVDHGGILLEDGSFDLAAIFAMENGEAFEVMYRAFHPYSNEEFIGIREFIVGVDSADPVMTAAALRTAIHNATGTRNNPTRIIIGASFDIPANFTEDNVNSVFRPGVAHTRHVRLITDGQQRSLTTGVTGRHFHVRGGSTLIIDDPLLHVVGRGTTNGGGIAVNGANAQFELRQGTVRDITHGDSAVRALNGATLIMGQVEQTDNSLAVITNNRSGAGGGVEVEGNNTTFTMHSGSISNNASTINAGLDLNAGGGGVRVRNQAVFEMRNGIITGNTARNAGGGIFLAGSASFIMHDGAITQNRVDNAQGLFHGGGGVMVQGGDSGVTQFTMHNGLIDGNTARGNGELGVRGGGVALYGIWSAGTQGRSDNLTNRARFIMHNGTISNNDILGTHGIMNSKMHRYVGGGGVGITRDAHFVMHDGTISDNISDSGGGVYVTEAARFDMHDGIITGNTARSQYVSTASATPGHPMRGGGGVMLYNSGVLEESGSVNRAPRFNMHGGSIVNNTALNGGGVFWVVAALSEWPTNMIEWGAYRNTVTSTGTFTTPAATAHQLRVRENALQRVTIGAGATISGNTATAGTRVDNQIWERHRTGGTNRHGSMSANISENMTWSPAFTNATYTVGADEHAINNPFNNHDIATWGRNNFGPPQAGPIPPPTITPPEPDEGCEETDCTCEEGEECEEGGCGPDCDCSHAVTPPGPDGGCEETDCTCEEGEECEEGGCRPDCDCSHAVNFFDVLFVLNGGVTNPGGDTYIVGQRVRSGNLVESVGDLIRQPTDVYTFMGWALQSDPTIYWDFNTDVVTEDITLIAVFEYYGVRNITINLNRATMFGGGRTVDVQAPYWVNFTIFNSNNDGQTGTSGDITVILTENTFAGDRLIEDIEIITNVPRGWNVDLNTDPDSIPLGPPTIAVNERGGIPYVSIGGASWTHEWNSDNTQLTVWITDIDNDFDFYVIECYCPDYWIRTRDKVPDGDIILTWTLPPYNGGTCTEPDCECPLGTDCENGECVPECECGCTDTCTEPDCVCPPGTDCENGECVPECECGCTDNGICTEPDCECPPGTDCENGECVPECECGCTDSTCTEPDCECPPGTDCENGECVPECECGCTDGICTEPDCECPPGTDCENGECVPECECGCTENGTFFHVMFELNGGTWASANSVRVPSGGTVAQPTNPTRIGHDFMGWTNAVGPFNFSTPILGNTILYANWQATGGDGGFGGGGNEGGNGGGDNGNGGGTPPTEPPITEPPTEPPTTEPPATEPPTEPPTTEPPATEPPTEPPTTEPPATEPPTEPPTTEPPATEPPTEPPTTEPPATEPPTEPPSPTTPDNTLVQYDDMWIELDENGVPLGAWVWNSPEDKWDFVELEDMPVPQAWMPQTGVVSNITMMIVSLIGSIVVVIVSVYLILKKHKNEVKQ